MFIRSDKTLGNRYRIAVAMTLLFKADRAHNSDNEVKACRFSGNFPTERVVRSRSLGGVPVREAESRS
jgi:hypothetical protein